MVVTVVVICRSGPRRSNVFNILNSYCESGLGTTDFIDTNDAHVPAPGRPGAGGGVSGGQGGGDLRLEGVEEGERIGGCVGVTPQALFEPMGGFADDVEAEDARRAGEPVRRPAEVAQQFAGERFARIETAAQARDGLAVAPQTLHEPQPQFRETDFEGHVGDVVAPGLFVHRARSPVGSVGSATGTMPRSRKEWVRIQSTRAGTGSGGEK